MSIIDILLLILILVGAYFGYKKGLLVEVLSFLAFIIAIVSAFKLMHMGVEYFSPDENPDQNISYAPYISFVIIFLLVFISILLLSRFLKRILDYTLLGSVDNWAGALFGGIKTAFALSLLIWLTHYAKIKLPENWTIDSFIYPKLISFAPQTVQYVSYVIPFQDIFPLIEKSLQGK